MSNFLPMSFSVEEKNLVCIARIENFWLTIDRQNGLLDLEILGELKLWSDREESKIFSTIILGVGDKLYGLQIEDSETSNLSFLESFYIPILASNFSRHFCLTAF